MAEFVVLRDSTTYNIILGRRTINDLLAIIYTKFLTIMFMADDGSVGTIRGYLEMVVTCDNASLSLRKRSQEAAGVFMVDLDARINENLRPKPQCPLLEAIRSNGDFSRHAENRPRVHVPSFGRETRSKAHPAEKEEDVLGESKRDGQANGKWMMCMDYSDLNKACPNDSFPLSNIDALVDAMAGCKFFSFMAMLTLEATFQRLMNKVFKDHIGRSVEVYVDNMLVKTEEPDALVTDLEVIFDSLRKHNMRLNLLKCAFVMGSSWGS
ncbi:uncharacterized protein [Arachis hypogaea]|uniref:uncharacterized protein n=1 Tax=Arachis hypogaea TaxID=3818 RepID=UPI000DEDA202|nr:uncharacterized protein LOC112786410 [Arachis hypogaea]